jgi:NAD(P)-dependent dehydrogenase (short-subunit alcohol dehydrogenase family)
MSTIDVSELLRPGLLKDVSIVLARAPAASEPDESLAAAVSAACAHLGARVHDCQLGSQGLEEAEIEQALGQAPERGHADDDVDADADAGDPEMLVVDGAGLFAHAAAGAGPEGARAALGVCLDISWNITRALANGFFLPGGRGGGGGRIVYLAPPADDGEHADAACAGLENLARTLSIEWARHGITAVAIASGVAMASEVAALTAYLASPAGAYFSGCLLDLRGAAAASG